MTAAATRLRNFINKPTWRAVLFWLLPAAFLGYFFYQPLLALFNLLISPEWGFNLQTLDWAQIWHPLWFTVAQATLSTLLTLIIGLPGAWLFARFSFPGKKTLSLLTTLPFILPTVVVAAGFNALLGPRGWVNLGLMALFNLDSAPIQFLNTFGAILTAHVFYNTTIVIRVVSNAWSRQNIRLQHAAQVLGANSWRTFKEVTLPLLRPSILAASLLVFLFQLHQLRCDPDAGRPALRHSGSGDLYPGAAPSKLAFGKRPVDHSTRMHTGDHYRIQPSFRSGRIGSNTAFPDG